MFELPAALQTETSCHGNRMHRVTVRVLLVHERPTPVHAVQKSSRRLRRPIEHTIHDSGRPRSTLLGSWAHPHRSLKDQQIDAMSTTPAAVHSRRGIST